MFENIDLTHRKQAAAIFLTKIHSPETFLYMIAFIGESSIDYTAWPSCTDDNTITARELVLARVLEPRTKGLLQSHRGNRKHYLYRYRINYLHRTVRDLLLMPIITAQLQKMSSEFDATKYMFYSIAVHISRLPRGNGELLEHLTSLFMQQLHRNITLDHENIPHAISVLAASMEDRDDAFDYQTTMWRRPASDAVVRDGYSTLGMVRPYIVTVLLHYCWNFDNGTEIPCPFALYVRMMCWTRGICRCPEVNGSDDECSLSQCMQRKALVQHLSKVHHKSVATFGARTQRVHTIDSRDLELL